MQVKRINKISRLIFVIYMQTTLLRRSNANHDYEKSSHEMLRQMLKITKIKRYYTLFIYLDSY